MKSSFTELSHLLLAQRGEDSPVAYSAKHLFTWGMFQKNVAGLCERLGNEPHGRWLLSCQSTYNFGVGLFALWQTDRVAVLPPNQQLGGLRETAQDVAGIMTDIPLSQYSGPVLSPGEFSGGRWNWKELDLTKPLMEIYTSGSTGERKVVLKTTGQLGSEVSVLEQTFGHRVGSSDIEASVSHQHIYGLLFRLLWPLCAGRAFSSETILFWEELVGCLEERKEITLIESPAHLERVNALGKTRIPFKNIMAIFSSGGALKEDTARLVQEKLGLIPVEVFGSTETGGIGWREQSGEENALNWRPLPSVVVSIEKDPPHRLIVQSPFVSSSEGKFVTGDVASVLPDGRFHSEGRADRIVKMAEKRISLDDMEHRMEKHPWVQRAAVTVLDPSGEETRSFVGAVVVLSAEGRKQQEKETRTFLVGNLRDYLKKDFDLSTVPRLFRFVETLPTDAQGKISSVLLKSLFQSRFIPSVTEPEASTKDIQEKVLMWRARVPESLGYFEGHFPGHPIVPGVVQIRWVMRASSAWFKQTPVVQQMEAIKFKSPLLAGQNFSLKIDRSHGDGVQTLRFSLTDGETLFSSGRLVVK